GRGWWSWPGRPIPRRSGRRAGLGLGVKLSRPNADPTKFGGVRLPRGLVPVQPDWASVLGWTRAGWCGQWRRARTAVPRRVGRRPDTAGRRKRHDDNAPGLVVPSRFGPGRVVARGGAGVCGRGRALGGDPGQERVGEPAATGRGGRAGAAAVDG